MPKKKVQQDKQNSGDTHFELCRQNREISIQVLSEVLVSESASEKWGFQIEIARGLKLLMNPGSPSKRRGRYTYIFIK